MVQKFESLFHLPEDCTFLNCAYMAPLLKSVEEAGIRGIQRRRMLHKLRAEDFFTEVNTLRQEFGQLIDAAADQVAVIPSVSYGIANVTRNLPVGRGDTIILAGEQFPSNYYPWERLAKDSGAEVRIVTPSLNSQQRGRDWNRNLLESIDSNTCCVAISCTHWADGTLFDLKSLRERTDQVGAWLVIDGTQSVGALPFSVPDIRPDALICAGYKWLLGPYSMGLAYYGERMKGGIPVEENWINRFGSEDFKGLVNYTSEYQPGHMRYSMGEQSNQILLPMMIEAIRTVQLISPHYVQEHTQRISLEAINALSSEGFHIEDSAYRAHHLFGVRLPAEMDPAECAEALSYEGIFVSWRGNALRVSPHVYNSPADLNKLADVLIYKSKARA